MEQHAVPRQITTFEFKMIGFLNIRQFAYLVFFAGLAAFFFLFIPYRLVGIIVAILIVSVGLAFAFYKHNERPLDFWIRKIIEKSLSSAQQYYFIKNNPIPDFLSGVNLTPNPALAEVHVDANEKLQKYMATTGQTTQPPKDETKIKVMLNDAQASQAVPQTQTQDTSQPAPTTIPTQGVPQISKTNTTITNDGAPHPFISGVIRNSKNKSLPEIMVYINDSSGKAVRILKTNHNGIFATFHPLPSGEYVLQPKDLGAKFFFDTMNITIDGKPQEPITIFSKELL